jgi:dynein heavy chain
MPLLDKIIEQLQNEPVHKEFRLWLSSSPNPDFPIAILQSSIKMTTEPPKGIKANMKRLYNLLTEQQFTRCVRQDKYKKLLFALCFFHSVLLERKKFLQLGWNVNYSFNDSDFEVCLLIGHRWGFEIMTLCDFYRFLKTYSAYISMNTKKLHGMHLNISLRL